MYFTFDTYKSEQKFPSRSARFAFRQKTQLFDIDVIFNSAKFKQSHAILHLLTAKLCQSHHI